MVLGQSKKKRLMSISPGKETTSKRPKQEIEKDSEQSRKCKK